MLLFVTLCLLARFGYSLNDVLTGRLARQFGRVEVAALRGVSLGVTMAPLLLWVPAGAWRAFSAHWTTWLLAIAVTAVSNILQNHAARWLPFGLRAAFVVSGVATGSIVLGVIFAGEHFSAPQIVLCVLVVGSAVVAAPGLHANHEIQPDVRKGGALALAAAILMAIVALLVKRLAAATDPLLTAWAWEFGAGLILLLPWWWQQRRGFAPGLGRRFWQIGVYASPTAVASGASLVALNLERLGLWGALSGTQVLFTAILGTWWHRETMGMRRWICFAVATGAVAALALVRL